MKKLFLISTMILAMLSTISAQQVDYIKTQNGKLRPWGMVDTARTLNATPVIVDTLVIKDNTAGILEVTVVGSSAAGDGITGKLLYRYHKASGTITVATADTIGTVTADTGLSGGTFALAASAGNNVKLTLTGKASTTVLWRWEVKPYYSR